MSHTPGPWSADYGDFAAYCDTGAEVCEASAGIRDDGTRIPCEEMEANLSLIAAAPELLAALKLLRDPDGDGEWTCDCDDPHFEGGMCENCVATAAIDKAEGRSE